VRRPILVATALLFLFLFAASPAAAHSDTGLLSLETSAAAQQPLEIRVRARLVYVNDRDPVSGATVTVEGTNATGATLPPTPLASQGDGVYTAVVTVPGPGAWTFRATSSEPDASAETTLAVARAPIVTTTTAPATTTARAAPPTGTPDRADASTDGESDSGGLWLLAAGAVVLVAVVVGAVAWLRARRPAAG
jgi:hypothetical protein